MNEELLYGYAGEKEAICRKTTASRPAFTTNTALIKGFATKTATAFLRV